MYGVEHETQTTPTSVIDTADPTLVSDYPLRADEENLIIPAELLPAIFSDAVESGFDEEGLVTRARHVNAEDLVIPSLNEITDRARTQAQDVLSQIGAETLPEDKRTLVAADFIAKKSYEGKERKTGTPYYYHPKRAAAMALHIFDQLQGEGYDIDRTLIDTVVCAEFLHDATEESIRSCKYFDPDRPESFSPLLIREIFTLTDNPRGKEIANSLRLMTHYAQQPWAPSYQRYISQGSSDFIFCLAKAPDMWDNLHIEPKPTAGLERAKRQKIYRKRVTYKNSIEELSRTAPWRTHNPENSAWARRYFDILRSIEPEDVPEMVENLDNYIYGPQAMSAA